ncbi:MAG: hypothetical protein JXB14_07160, partial [Candidatus Altiarchaeota archaeon]|nr:hypothetical protein [Candidatus Altiarchaeota archaeon]
VEALLRGGASSAATARELHTTPTTIHKLRVALGIPLPKTSLRGADPEKRVEALKASFSSYDPERLEKACRKTVRNIRKLNKRIADSKENAALRKSSQRELMFTRLLELRTQRDALLELLPQDGRARMAKLISEGAPRGNLGALAERIASTRHLRRQGLSDRDFQ